MYIPPLYDERITSDPRWQAYQEISVSQFLPRSLLLGAAGLIVNIALILSGFAGKMLESEMVVFGLQLIIWGPFLVHHTRWILAEGRLATQIENDLAGSGS